MRRHSYFDGLPDHCYVENTLHARGPEGQPNPQLLLIKRGEPGYHPIYTRTTADAMNAHLGVTPAQREAMLVGSMVGWQVPGANPASYDEEGKLR